MKYLLKYIILTAVIACFYFQANAQKGYSHYNVDSLLRKLSRNTYISKTVKEADAVYKHARIPKEHISLNAFRIAYLEKRFLDSNFITVRMPTDSLYKGYNNRGILTIVDFTKDGKHKRFITVDVQKQKILFNTLVSHGTATGNGLEELTKKYSISKSNINSLKGIPAFFSNRDSSYRSSLGLVIAFSGDDPDNLCHVCKYFLSRPHKCNVLLEGLEEGINDKDLQREIIIHTTGSKDFSDSASAARIASMLQLSKDETDGLVKKDCGCLKAGSIRNSYASACSIKENKGFIGRSSGCFVLPEEAHLPIMEAIQNGSLLFVYSNIIAPTSTNYFEESPVIKAIVKYAKMN